MNFSVTQYGLPLDKSKYNWDEKTKTFSSNESSLVLDFTGINGVTFKTGSYCSFNTGYDCTFDTSSDCTFYTGFCCTFNTGSDCTFNTGFNCTFNTGYDCTFDTDSNCTFITGSDCTFDTGSDCTFNTGFCCTFNTNFNCVIIRRDIFEIIQPKEGVKIKLNPRNIKGYLEELKGRFYLNGDIALGEHDVFDGILSKIVSKRKNKDNTVYKVINHGQENISYVIEHNGKFSHGKTIKEAKESLVYKLSDRDTSKYQDYTLDTQVTLEQAIPMYMDITGACAYGTKMFVDSQENLKKSYSIQELIKLTEGQYGHSVFKEFFKKD